MLTYKNVAFFLGPFLFILLLHAPFTLFNPLAHKVIAGAVWMIVWWLTEAVAIPVTALIPLTVFPLVGIDTIDSIAANYAHPIVWLFFGGFIIALALEKVNLHKRLALRIIRLTGTRADGVVFGFMTATALLSMWISNTASTVVMLPIAVSVIGLLIDDRDGFTPNDRNFALSIMLGIAFAANIGGTATLIGTPPNLVAAAFLQETYQIQIGFLQWMLLGIPFSCIMLLICYTVLVKWFYPNRLGELRTSGDLLEAELRKLGVMSKGEKIVSGIFLLTAGAWILRGSFNDWFPGLNLTDAGISLVGALLMLTVPLSLREGKFTLEWDETRNLPWGILLLFGGGLALAGSLKNAGLINLIGGAIAGYDGLSVFIITLLLITIMLFMTELMSNVALTAVFVPVVAGIAEGLEVPLLQMIVPVTLAASCAFMLPMATPPNAIVFASGHIKVHQMARAGVVLNILSIALLTAMTYFLFPLIF